MTRSNSDGNRHGLPLRPGYRTGCEEGQTLSLPPKGRKLMDAGPGPDKGDVDELTKEFIAESQEGLDRMELCLTELEKRPDGGDLVSEIFRAVHTIKGTTGFLGFGRLEKLAHAGEGLLGVLRDGKLAVTADLVGGLLGLLDGLRRILRTIEATGSEAARTAEDDAELFALMAELKAGVAELTPDAAPALRNGDASLWLRRLPRTSRPTRRCRT